MERREKCGPSVKMAGTREEILVAVPGESAGNGEGTRNGGSTSGAETWRKMSGRTPVAGCENMGMIGAER